MRMLIQYSALTLLMAASVGALAADVKENWDKECAKCHGADGKGQTRMGRQSGARDYTDAKVQAELDDAKAARQIKEGLKDKSGKEKMKAYDQFSDDEVKALI